MQQYTAYGLCIDSAFDLPELREGGPDSGGTDVVVEPASLTPVPEDADHGSGRRIDITPERCRISYEDVGTFRIEDGTRILVDAERPDVPGSKVFRRLLEGQVLGVCCHQRGLLVLHGSAVQIDGEAVVFLGPTGAGKSTTAAAFYGAGHSLLDDDIVVVEPGDDAPTVAPGVPQLKLTPEMSERFDIDAEHVDASQTVTEKTHYRTETAAVDRFAVPLGGCYVLQEGPAVAIDGVTGHDAMLELIANTYTSGLLDETERTATNFRQCTSVVTTTPVKRLYRPKELDILPELIAAVMGDVTGS